MCNVRVLTDNNVYSPESQIHFSSKMQANILIITALVLVLNFNHLVIVVVAPPPSTEFKYFLDDGYPLGSKSKSQAIFGNIAGVDLDKKNNIIIFHRGSHQWRSETFDNNNNYLPNDGPIPEMTVVTIDPNELRVTRAWGSNLFYLPHGLSLSPDESSVWLTDVALHQVFKYSIDGTRELLVLGTQFTPGNDESHFCKPTSVADTGDFIFVADGYCNSRVVMFSPNGKYIGEFGQSGDVASFLPSLSSSSLQPVFNLPHKLTYAKEANMLCVADRENGRIQCFSFEPKRAKNGNGLVLGGAIKPKFTIADPQFNGKVFSIDYSPVRGGMLVAISGKSYGSLGSTDPLGFVYNVTTGQLISKFSPPHKQIFGMAHDLAITNDDARSIYVVDIDPINLWKFSRKVPSKDRSTVVGITNFANEKFSQAVSIMHTNNKESHIIWYAGFIVIAALILYLFSRMSSNSRRSFAANSFASLYSNSYPNGANNMFSSNRFGSKPMSGRVSALMGSMFSRGTFMNLFNLREQRQSDFSRIPLEESDNSDDDKSDSDVEEFNINQANTNIKIEV